MRRLAAPGKPADPAFSPLGRRIAFSSRSEIWVMFEDGTSVRQVTVGPEPSRDPTWSPAADALAFTTGYAGDRDLYSVSADGNRLRQLTSGARRRRGARLGPDAARSPSCATATSTSRRPGRRARPLTGGAADDRDPVWSPDGRRIAFTRLPERVPAPKAKKGRKRKRPAPRVRELWVMRANGSKARRLKQLPAAVSAPAWSPDGRLLAFAMGRSGRRGLYTIRSTGHGVRQVASRAADPRAIDWQPRGGDPVIAAAGDIACDPDLTRFATGLGTRDACHMLQTSDLLMKMDLAAVLPLGDLQYEDGTLDKFQRSFDPTWGRLKAQMRPVVGNHEYRTAGAAGYFDYFNGPGVFDGPAGPRDKGYYSYDLGAWHVVTLNSQCSHPPADNPYKNDCAAGSPQEQWLRADLAAHPARCTLAVWHHPLVQLGPRGAQRRGPAAVPGALRQRRRRPAHRPRPRLRALRPDGRHRQPRRRPRRAPVRGRHGRQEQGARPGPPAQQRGPREHLVRGAEDDAAARRLPVGVRPRRRDVHRTPARTPATEARGYAAAAATRAAAIRARRARCVEAQPSSAASSCARLKSQCTSASQVKPMPPWSWIAAEVTSRPASEAAALAIAAASGRRSGSASAAQAANDDRRRARPRCRAASARSGARRPGRRRRACRTACGP